MKPKLTPAMVRYDLPVAGTLAHPKCRPVDDMTGTSKERTCVIVPNTRETLKIMSTAAAIAGICLAERDVSETQLLDWHAETPNLPEGDCV